MIRRLEVLGRRSDHNAGDPPPPQRRMTYEEFRMLPEQPGLQ